MALVCLDQTVVFSPRTLLFSVQLIVIKFAVATHPLVCEFCLVCSGVCMCACNLSVRVAFRAEDEIASN